MARHAQFLDRLSLIEARLDQLEERFNSAAMSREAAAPSSSPTTASTPGSPVTDLTALFDLGTPAAPPTTPTFISRTELADGDAREDPKNSGAASPVRESLERIIGGRWYAVLGGLVVIIGVAFFYQYAVQQGWFRILPPWAKCGAGGIFGAALLIAAELIRPRINAWAAVGLSAAGIGTMYVSAYAAYAKYGLVTWPTAFVMLTLCAAVGIIFAARAGLVAVAIVSLIGGYLTPLMLHNPDALPMLPPYWLMLLSVGLILSGRLAGSFVHLRWMTYWATIIFCGLWVLGPGDRYPLMAIVTLGFAWCAIHAELWWSAARESRADTDEQEPSAKLDLPAFLRPPTWSPLVSSFCITVWAVGLGVIHARGWGQIPDWLPAAGGAAATGLAALVLAGNLRILRDMPRTAAERLGAGLTAQAGALLITAVALALTGRLEVISWLGMGVAAIFAGRWMGSRAVGSYGALLLFIATARLITYDAAFSTMPAPLFTNLGLVFSWWMILMVAAAVCWMIVARLIQTWPIGTSDPDDRGGISREDIGEVIRSLTAGASGLSVALLLMSFIHAEASAMSITLVWMGLGSIAMACSRLAPAFRLDVHSAWITLIALIAWSIAFIAPGWSRNTDAPGLQRGLIIALALAAQFILIARAFAQRLAALDPNDDRVGPVRAAGLIGATLLVFVATSFEVSRAAGILFTDRTGRLAAVSIWWGLFALALLAVGFLRKTSTSQAARRAGLALLGFATAKALFLDTSQVSLGWRVISVLGLGLLMLGVGVAYARLSRRAPEASDPPPTRSRAAAIGSP